MCNITNLGFKMNILQSYVLHLLSQLYLYTVKNQLSLLREIKYISLKATHILTNKLQSITVLRNSSYERLSLYFHVRAKYVRLYPKP